MNDTAAARLPRTAGRAILWGGLICGVLDISSAVIISLANHGSPVRMLQGIAGALLGPVSFQGGFATAALGRADVRVPARQLQQERAERVASEGQRRISS